MRKLLLLSLLYLSNLLLAQNTNVSINTFVKAYKNGSSTTEALKAIKELSFNDFISQISPLLTDSLSDNREAAYKLLSQITYDLQNPAQNKIILNFLIKGCKDPDTGIAGRNMGYLERTPTSLFDPELKNEVANTFRSKPAHFARFVKLCGYIGIADLTYDFRKMLTEKTYPNKSAAWSIHLALARMGEADQIDYCIERVRKQTINDDVVYDLAPDLAYTRQKKSIEFLFEIIKNDDKNCHSSNPDTETPILCGYRIMELLAPIVNGFPVNADASGDIATKDYDKALQLVREWIDSKYNYTLKTDIY